MHVLLSIVLGLLILIGIVAIPVMLGWLMFKLDQITPPQWLQTVGLCIVAFFIIFLAYQLGSAIL